MRQYQREVSGHSVLQCGDQVVAAHALFRSSSASSKVSERLHHDAVSAEHVGELGDLLAVLDGSSEWLCEILGDKQGKVGVVCLVFFALVSVSVDDRQIVIVIFRRYFSRRIGAECADFVIKGRRVIDQLGLVEILIEELHDLIPDFHTDADIHGARHGLDPELFALAVQPVRAVAADRHNDSWRVKLLVLFRLNAHGASITDQDRSDGIVETHVNARVLQMMLELFIDLVSLLGAEMADRALHKLQVCADRLGADLLDLLLLANTVHISIGTELEVDLIRSLDQFFGLCVPENIRQSAADIR